jgi:hypothetical protein
MNEALRSATKQFGFDGIDLVRCLQKFAAALAEWRQLLSL